MRAVILLYFNLFSLAALSSSTIVNITGLAGLFFSQFRDARQHSNVTVLVHVHIPKAAGSALAIALASGCSECPRHRFRHNFLGCRVSSCRKVKGTNGFEYQYSVSRATGWPCGTHAPYHRMRSVPCRGAPKLSKRGLRPMFVIMLREPFERFMSEVLSWNAKHNGLYIDWGAKLKSKAVQGQVFNSSAYLLEVAGLPENKMVHNRNIKMIGGQGMDYNPRYIEKRLGSRWISGPERNAEVYKNARKVLRRGDVLLGIAARFAESLCMLEILYGDLQEFRWNATRHSHSRSKAKSFDPKERLRGNSTGVTATIKMISRSKLKRVSPVSSSLQSSSSASTSPKGGGGKEEEGKEDEDSVHEMSYEGTDESESQQESELELESKSERKQSDSGSDPQSPTIDTARNSEIYSKWIQRNQEDVQLYEYATALFEVQFQAALKLYSSYSQREKQHIYAPHCSSFVR